MKYFHTIVVGSGAAGLAAALRLKSMGVNDIAILTEGLNRSTSINTGSDKQTYYKLSLYGNEADSPGLLAETMFAGGSMHGDLALVEAALSDRCFQNLVNLNVPFPRDRFGQFIGYKTDHDPRRRATSCGPYTSREMCRALIKAVQQSGIEIIEHLLVTDLIIVDDNRCAGVVARHEISGKVSSYYSNNTVFAVGGPGALYKSSVYPAVHNGAIGVALKAGATAQSLPESQYGLASTKFRWNVSGTYMQVLPRFVSTNEDGNDPREFLYDAFANAGEAESLTFLKGYQWPFDVKKSDTGSSQIDLLVYQETCCKNRRVFLDFRTNPAKLDFNALSAEAAEYLRKSEALFGTPIERLQKMNPGAIELYDDHKIDLYSEMLEIEVCAQHNNGGLAGNHWYESLNIKHLFPIGEVNGSHGVCRPGGSALNAGQVGAFRAAEYIANVYDKPTLKLKKAKKAGKLLTQSAKALLKGTGDWRADRLELQSRMSKTGSHYRNLPEVRTACEEAKQLYLKIAATGYPANAGNRGLNNLQLALAHWVYLSAIIFQIESGAGSRGSALALVDGKVDPENPAFREQVLESTLAGDKIIHQWVPRRALPDTEDGWFENIWRDFRNGTIYAAL